MLSHGERDVQLPEFRVFVAAVLTDRVRVRSETCVVAVDDLHQLAHGGDGTEK